MSDDQHEYWNGHSAAWADGARVPIYEDRSGEDLLHRLCADFGWSMATAIDVVAWFDENQPQNAAPKNSSGDCAALLAWFERAVIALVNYQDRQKDDPKMLRMSTRIWALALDFTLAAGGENPCEVARNLGLQRFLGQSGKATTNKAFLDFMAQLNLAPKPGQRSEESRRKMAEARRRQLCPK